MQQFYQAALATAADPVSVRSAYAHYAYLAGDWKAADGLFKLIGDNPNLSALDCTREQYEEMRRHAAERAREQAAEP